jgi:hypothetical protein
MISRQEFNNKISENYLRLKNAKRIKNQRLNCQGPITLPYPIPVKHCGGTQMVMLAVH